nr:hypothetical protein [uncultured Flavobacterium sp.]
MTINDFNNKWKANLRERAVGLEIENAKVVDYLDQEFLKEIITNPYFEFTQIKIKVGTTRIYSNSDKQTEWELAIDKMLQQ